MIASIIQGKEKVIVFKKTRADDFKYEAEYIYKCLKKKIQEIF